MVDMSGIGVDISGIWWMYDGYIRCWGSRGCTGRVKHHIG